jgi:hypothetical protein
MAQGTVASRPQHPALQELPPQGAMRTSCPSSLDRPRRARERDVRVDRSVLQPQPPTVRPRLPIVRVRPDVLVGVRPDVSVSNGVHDAMSAPGMRSTRFSRRWPGPLIAKMSQWCRSRSRISPQRHCDLDARAPGSEPRIVISARLAPSPPNSPHPRESLQRNRIRPFRRSPPFVEVCLTARPRAQSITASARTTSRNRRLPFRSFPDRDTARGGRTSPRPEESSSPRECG